MVAPTREAAERRVCGRAGSRLQMRRQARLEGCAPARGCKQFERVRECVCKRGCVPVSERRRKQLERVSEHVHEHGWERMCKRGCKPLKRVSKRGAVREQLKRARNRGSSRCASGVARGSSASPSASSTSHSNPHASAHERPRAPSPTRTLPRLADSGKIPEFASGLRHADLHTAPVQSSARSQAELSARTRRLVLIQFVSVGGMHAGPVPRERSVLFPRLIEGAH